MTPVVDTGNLPQLAAEVRAAARRLREGDTVGVLAILAPLTSGPSAYLPARFLLAMTAWKMGRLDWALSLMRECHELWPMDGTVAEILASLEAQAGNLRESLYMGKMGTALGGPGELLELVPEDFPPFDWAFLHIKDQPMLSRAKQSFAGGRLRAAIEAAAQHAALNPEDGDARAFHAALLLRGGQAVRAAEALRAIEDAPAFPASCASLYARALTASGAFDAARRWHDRALSLAPDDAEIAAARVLDALWLDAEPAQRAARGADWAQRFVSRPAAPQWRPPEGKLVIGYIVAGLADPRDAAAVGALARAHDRKRVTVLGYGVGAQSWDENAPYRGAFDQWLDTASLHPATLARFFERGGAQVIVDASGFAAPKALLALARVSTAIRVSWLGNPAGLGQPVYDACMVALGDQAAGKAVWPTGLYPALPPLGESARVAHSGIHFGADIGMAQVDADAVGLWSAALQAQPDAKLLLRSNDMANSASVARLIAAFGQELAARIDIVNADRIEDFYARIDVALTPRRAVSARVAAEALACGVPVVAPEGDGRTEPHGAFLADLGLSAMLTASDDWDYAARAARLGPRGEARNRALAMIAAVQSAGAGRARSVAQALEAQAEAHLKTAAKKTMEKLAS